MRCIGGFPRRGIRTPTLKSPADPSPPLTEPNPPFDEGDGDGDQEGGQQFRKRNGQSPLSSSAQTSAVASPSATINLSREYTRVTQTSSYNEIWDTIHHARPEGGGEGEGEGVGDSDADADAPSSLLTRVLQPDRASIEEALRDAPSTHLTRLVSLYLDSSEHISHFCLSLGRSLDRARSIYGPIRDLLDLLPEGLHSPLTQAQCNWAFDTFLEFDHQENPFPTPSSSLDDEEDCGGFQFQGLRRCFLELKQHLDLRLLKARRRERLMRCAVRGSGVCLVACTTAVAVAGIVLATHGMVTLMAGPMACFVGGCDFLPHPREHMEQLEAAARGPYVLNRDLETIERLVARLHATVESDKMLVRLGLERGRGHRHSIEEVVRQLRKNHPSFLHQLIDLDEHICLYFTAVNRARSLLFRQILLRQT